LINEKLLKNGYKIKVAHRSLNVIAKAPEIYRKIAKI